MFSHPFRHAVNTTAAAHLISIRPPASCECVYSLASTPNVHSLDDDNDPTISSSKWNTRKCGSEWILASFWWNWVEEWGRGWGWWWWCACRRQMRGAFTRMSLFWNPPFLWVPASLLISLFFLLCSFNSERALNVNDEMRVRALDDMNFEMSKRRTVRLCTKRVKDLKDVRMVKLFCALRPSTSTSAEKKVCLNPAGEGEIVLSFMVR